MDKNLSPLRERGRGRNKVELSGNSTYWGDTNWKTLGWHSEGCLFHVPLNDSELSPLSSPIPLRKSPGLGSWVAAFCVKLGNFLCVWRPAEPKSSLWLAGQSFQLRGAGDGGVVKSAASSQGEPLLFRGQTDSGILESPLCRVSDTKPATLLEREDTSSFSTHAACHRHAKGSVLQWPRTQIENLTIRTWIDLHIIPVPPLAENSPLAWLSHWQLWPVTALLSPCRPQPEPLRGLPPTRCPHSLFPVSSNPANLILKPGFPLAPCPWQGLVFLSLVAARVPGTQSTLNRC